jgi:type III secretion protein R
MPNPVMIVIVLAALSLAPFVVIMLTSFVKISVVLSILRNALGTQSVPPNQVITGLAFVLSIFVMAPVARQMYHDAGSLSDTGDIFSEASVRSVFDGIQRGKEPLRYFLGKHAHTPDRLLFIELAGRLDQAARSNVDQAQRGNPPNLTPANAARSTESTQAPGTSSSSPTTGSAAPPAEPVSAGPSKNDFQVLIPAFVTSQLKEAFQIGFLIFVPFIIIDMVVANILLAMGMIMLSPSVISLPFKLLLFILVDGWVLIVRGLVLSYAS